MTELLLNTTTRVLATSELRAPLRQEMFDLLSQHFEGVRRVRFDQDLAEKNWVILLSRNSRLVGFSTLLVYDSLFQRESIGVVYSGDTIVAPEAWGTPALARAWITSVNQLRRLFPREKYYWLLLTSGFRTYRFLPVFWREFYPSGNAPTPPEQRCLLDHLAIERFGAQYDTVTGVVRFAEPQKLRHGLAEVPPGRIGDPHIAFFLARNPGHHLGDELVCLTELTERNLTRAGWRMVEGRTYEVHGGGR